MALMWCVNGNIGSIIIVLSIIKCQWSRKLLEKANRSRFIVVPQQVKLPISTFPSFVFKSTHDKKTGMARISQQLLF